MFNNYTLKRFQKQLVMKQLLLLLLISCITTVNYSFASENNSYNSITLFNFDTSCMQQYEYEVDEEFVIDDNHKAYHIKLDAERTVVLKVLDRTNGLAKVNTSFTVLHDCKSIKGIQPQFVIGVNSNSTPVFVKKNDLYYKVASAEYNVDSEAFFSSFAPPHHSFVYEYSNEYDPLETLRPTALDALDYDTRNYYYSTEQERESYNFIYLQVYRDACANRPFGIVTPRSDQGQDNSYKYSTPSHNISSTTSVKQIYRTCQHPVEVKYIKGLGTGERSYEEDGKLYISKLVRIDGVDLATYLESHTFVNENVYKSADLDGDIVWEHDLTKMPKSSLFQPTYIIGTPDDDANKNIQLSGTNTEKSAKRIIPTTYKTTTNTSNTVTLKVPHIIIDGKKHTVEKGETLYSISQKYDISVLDIKINNQLSENTIEIGQELIIDKK